jgi:hypothetical protein
MYDVRRHMLEFHFKEGLRLTDWMLFYLNQLVYGAYQQVQRRCAVCRKRRPSVLSRLLGFGGK